MREYQWGPNRGSPFSPCVPYLHDVRGVSGGPQSKPLMPRGPSRAAVRLIVVGISVWKTTGNLDLSIMRHANRRFRLNFRTKITAVLLDAHETYQFIN